jgi:predicted ATPase
MKLHAIELKGFKSIDGHHGQYISLGDVTVLLGANGSGKSNLVSFFKLLNYMTTGALQQYVGKYGSRQLLFYGPGVTESIAFTLHFSSPEAEGTYEVVLSYGLPDRLFVNGEKVTILEKNKDKGRIYQWKNGGAETGLATNKKLTSKVVYRLLSGIRAYQFHDTSDTAKIKDRGYIEDATYLRHDAGNLAAFLIWRLFAGNAAWKREVYSFELDRYFGKRLSLRPGSDFRWLTAFYGAHNAVAPTSTLASPIYCSG